MSSPSTHQDSPKVPEALERAIKRLRELAPNEVHQASVHVRTGVASELEELRALLADFIPVSALLSDEAKRAAEAAAGRVAPTCNVCQVEYVPEYEGPCQEPLPPFDGSRTCSGTVSIRPDAIATAALQAAIEQVGGKDRG